MQDQLLPLVLEERKLAQQVGAKHPDLIAVRKKIEIAGNLMVLPPTVWNAAVDKGGKSIDPVALQVQVLKQKLEYNKVSEDLLAKVFIAEQEETRRLAFYEIENDSYVTGIALNQKLYEALAKRLNEMSLVRNAGGYQIDLLETPLVGKKVAPSMSLTLLIGALLGLMLGVGLGRLADMRERAARVNQDADTVTAQAGRFHVNVGNSYPNGNMELATERQNHDSR
jgi:hypothetical protein